MTRPTDMHPAKWTDADFESLSWHDCTIHSLGLVQDAEFQSDLVIDLDFILEWLPTPEGAFQFRLAPARLRFHHVDKLTIRILMDYKQPMEISEVQRFRQPVLGYTNYHWMIELQTYPGRENHIEFDATGFSQELTARSLLTDRQSLQFAERSEMIRANGEQGAAPNDSPAPPPANSDVPDGPSPVS